MPKKKSRKSKSLGLAGTEVKTNLPAPDIDVSRASGSNNHAPATDVIVLSDDDHDVPKQNSGAWGLMKNAGNHNQRPITNIHQKFPAYNDSKLAHILYCQLRILNLFAVKRKAELEMEVFCHHFWEFYHEDFFRFEVLKHFVKDAESDKCVSQFIEGFCGHFLILAGKSVFCQVDIHELSVTIYNEFVGLLEKVTDLRQNLTFSIEPTPAEMQLLGQVNGHVSTVGRRHALNFDNMNENIRGSQPSIKEVGQRVVQIRKKIARSGFMVKLVDVTEDVCKYYNVSSIRNLHIKGSNGMIVTRETDIPEMLEIVRLQAKVNAFIQAFVTFRNICTLHELQLDLCKMENKTSFEEFNLGPLERQHLVYEHFKFPYEMEIPQITTIDVFRSLQRFMNENRGGPKFVLTDFLAFYIKNTNYKTPFETGIRMHSMPLAIQCVGKAVSYSKRNENDSIELFKDDLVLEMNEYLKQAAVKLFRPSDYQPGAQNVSLISQMKQEDLLKSLKLMVNTIEGVKKGNQTLQKSSRNFLFKSCDQIKQLLNIISKCELSSRMLHLVLCTGIWQELKKDDITILLDLGFKEAATEIIENEAKQHQLAARKISESPKLEVKKLIKNCLQRKSKVKFTELCHVETWVVNQANNEDIKSFEDFGHGSFLKFISTDRDLLNLVSLVLEMEGGKGLNSSHSISKEDIKEFLKQCFVKSKNKEEIIRVLKLQFQLNDMNPTMQQLIDQIFDEEEENKKRCTTTTTSPFTFSTGLLCETDVQFNTSTDTSDKTFYHLAREQIKHMPVLVDIGEYTNWKNLYFWKLGHLKHVLKQMSKDKSMENILFLQCCGSESFVKIHKNTSTDDFNSAVRRLDSSKAMDCFMSVIVSSGFIKDAPLALMVSYVKTTFLHHARDKDVNNEDPLSSPLLRFTLECFELLPFDILVSVAEKLFLATLEEVYGAKHVPDLLLTVAKEKGLKTLSLLHALGYQLAIQEWILSHDEEIQSLKEFQDSSQFINEHDETTNEVEDTKEEDIINVQNIANKDEPEEEEVVEVDEIDEKNIKKEVEEIAITTETSIIEEDKDDIVDSTTIDASVNEDIEMAEDDISYPHEDQESAENKEDSEEVIQPVDEKTERLNYCLSLIEEIREKQFGIGVEFSEKGKAMIKTYREREGRSLDRLSKELYTKDSHFVLELIQNADDNEYFEENMAIDSEEKPTVAFIVENDKVTVLNNEKGFMEKNIRALCDVGKSTKGIHRKGYIGQKGIGFKSVFRVTDAPNIHSNGFHIKFDASQGPNGYILPEWLEYADEFEQESISQNDEYYSWRTQIVLPLKEEMQLEKLTSRFHDIDPSLLMFLNRLQTIVIDDRVTGKVKTMSKKKVGENLVELCENGERSLWFVVSKEVPISIRPDVSETSISVAFPISLEKQIPQKVFAFLPLRSYGFKYIIQADFEVPSSREDIDKDSPWNQYILNKIPTLVLDAFASFKHHEHFKGLDGVITFFKFMEHQDHVLGIFKRVQGEIMRKLQQEECLPVLPDQEMMEVSWALPSTVVQSKYDNKSVITPKMLRSYLNLKYIHPEIKSKKVSTEVLSALGVSQLSLNQLVEILKGYIIDLGHHSDVLFPWIGRWMSVVATVLQDECDFSETTHDMLRALKMVPVVNGNSLISLAERVVFFPVASNTFLQKNKKDSSLSLDIIEKDLCIVSRELSRDTDDLESELIRRLLKELGVKSMTPSDLINDYIIPSFKDGSWKVKSKETVIAYVCYLCEQYHLNSNLYDISDLASCIVLQTNKGFEKPADTFIYLTTAYGNQMDLESQFSACQWTLISDVYLRFGASKKSQVTLSPPKWQEFFDLIGLKYFTTLQKDEKTLHKSDLVSSPWKQRFETWPQTEDDTYVIHDLVCPEFERLLESGNQQQLQAFGLALDAHWEKYFAEKDVSRPTCKVTSTDGQKLKLDYSSFFLQLRFSPWVVASNSQMCPPFNLYVHLDNIRTILADKTLYFTLPLTNTAFVQVLGLRTELKFEDFIQEFKQWRSQNDFVTSRNHMVKVYEYLRGEFVRWPKEGNELLRNAFIFLPDLSLNRDAHCSDPGDTPHKGRFYMMNEVCWEDPSRLIAKEAGSSSRRILEDFYVAQDSSLRDFFLKELQVERYPQPIEYLTLVARIAEKTRLPDNTNVHNILRLFQVVGSICILPDMKASLYEWRESPKFEDTLKFYQSMDQFMSDQTKDVVSACQHFRNLLPTHHNRFVGIQDRLPILVFDDDMAEIFKKEKTVDFIYFNDIKRLLEKSRSESKHQYFRQGVDDKLLKIMFFFKACKLLTLTELYLPPDINPEQIESGCYLWQSKLHEISPYVQRYLSHKETEHYTRLQAINFASYLRNTTFFSAYRFEVVSRLKSRRDVNVTQTKVAHVEHSINDLKKATIYVIKEHAENPEAEDDILREIVRIFVPNNDVKLIDDLFDFICSLLIESNKEIFMTRRKKIPALIRGEVEWDYPKPPEPYVEVIEEDESEDEEMMDVTKKQDDGERPMTCWPPRNPGGTGRVPKPEHLKKQENEILEKWEMPEAPKAEKAPGVQRAEQYSKIKSPRLNTNSTDSSDTPASASISNPATPRSAENPTTTGKVKGETSRSVQEKSKNVSSTIIVPSTQVNNDRLKTEGRFTTPNKSNDQELSSGIQQQNPGVSHVIHDVSKQKDEKPQHELQELSNDERKTRTSSLQEVPGTPQRGIQTPGTPKGTPSKFNIDQFPVYALSTEYKDIPYELTSEFEERILSSDCHSAGVSDVSISMVVGKLGEEIVYHHFVALYKEQQHNGQVEVCWINQEEETGEPYDFIIKKYNDVITDESGQTSKVLTSCVYVEVKTTLMNEEKQFEISSQQLKFALEEGANFHLYRVSGLAAQTEFRLRCLENLALYMDKKAVKMFMVL